MRFKDAANESATERLPFLKIKDGEEVTGVFKGLLYEFYQVWATKEAYPWDTPRAERPQEASFRFRINFITKEGASYVAKVMEQGSVIYNALRDLNEEYPLDTTVVKIKRTGSTKDDTRYSILPVSPKNQPTEKGWAVINQAPLIKLEHGDVKAKASQEPAFDKEEWPEDRGQDPDSEHLPF